MRGGGIYELFFLYSLETKLLAGKSNWHLSRSPIITNLFFCIDYSVYPFFTVHVCTWCHIRGKLWGVPDLDDGVGPNSMGFLQDPNLSMVSRTLLLYWAPPGQWTFHSSAPVQYSGFCLKWRRPLTDGWEDTSRPDPVPGWTPLEDPDTEQKITE